MLFVLLVSWSIATFHSDKQLEHRLRDRGVIGSNPAWGI